MMYNHLASHCCRSSGSNRRKTSTRANTPPQLNDCDCWGQGAAMPVLVVYALAMAAAKQAKKNVFKAAPLGKEITMHSKLKNIDLVRQGHVLRLSPNPSCGPLFGPHPMTVHTRDVKGSTSTCNQAYRPCRALGPCHCTRCMRSKWL